MSKKKIKGDIVMIEELVKILLIVLFVIGIIIFIIWFLVNYGNTPVGELPTWLWWLMN